MTFDTLPLAPAQHQTLAALGLTTLTPIQTVALPLALAGTDLVALAPTGSGKSYAFLLPLLQQVSPERRLGALILTPTRELAKQLVTECRKLGRHLPGLRVLSLTGGEALGPQADSLALGVHIGIGTPGRIVDHLQKRTLHLQHVRYVVLDEADRMLELGFADSMERIRDELPNQRQTLLFSATFADDLERLAQRWAGSARRVEIKAEGAPTLREIAVRTEQKLETLEGLLAEGGLSRTLVFCNLKETVKSLTVHLRRSGVATAGLHGDLLQEERDEVLACLRGESLSVLVATDVAARGLDIEGLDRIINYDLPAQPEVYVHRVGRTGRAGAPGVAISLHEPHQAAKLDWLMAGRPAGLERIDDTAVTRDPAAPQRPPLPPRATLRIAGGRKDKLRPGDILGALTGEGGLGADAVGLIQVGDRTSFVSVSRDQAARAYRALSEGRIKAKKFRVQQL